MEENNNMEEFFKRSLEQFNEVPSDDVWTNVSDRLTLEAKWYDPIVTVLKSALPFLIALLMIGAYHLYIQNNISNYKNDLSAAKDTIENLQTENKEYLSQINGIEQLKTDFLENINGKNLEIEKLTKENKSLAYSYNQLLNKSKGNSNSQGAFTLQNLRNQIRILEERIQLKDAEILAFKDKQNFENLSPSNRTTEVFCSQFKYLPRVRSNRIINQNHLLSVNKPNSVTPNAPRQTEDISNIRYKRFKLGLKARYFNTLVKDSKLVNPGFSQGIRAEYMFGKNWGVTGEVLYNQRTYTIAANQGSFSPESLKKYPGGVDRKLNVNNISARTRYFDASLGIKYMPNYGNNKTNFFINPSVVWHVYLPQDYQFGLTQESDIHYTERTYLAYFGSGNLNVGFERKINSSLHFQVGLWGEQSFIPLGYERQYVSMFGASTSILF